MKGLKRKGGEGRGADRRKEGKKIGGGRGGEDIGA